MIYLDYQAGTFVNTTKYQIIQIGTGDGVTFARPNVVYNNTVYRYIDNPTPVDPETDPITYVTPNTDSNAVALYELGAGSVTDVLTTPLTGLSVSSGTPSVTSTILQAMGFLTYKSYLLLTGFAVASVANGALNVTSVTATSKSSDITPNTTDISIPINKIYTDGQIKLNVTTGATSGATFTVTGANCTVVSETLSVGASVTGQVLIINFTVVSTTTASPTISITASGVTGTVAINNSSSIKLS